MKKYVDKDALQDFATKLHTKQKSIFALRNMVGSPLVANLAADMTDETKVYVYVGSESGYTAGNWYYYNGSAWVSGGVYNAVAVQTDASLAVSGMAADAKATGDAIAEVEAGLIEIDDTLTIEGKAADAAAVGAALAGHSGSGLTEDIKQALLGCFENVAWINEEGQTYYDALEAALYPDATLVSISAVYTQSGTVYDTDSLNSLKADLVVTAHYDDGSSSVISSYTLSGTLTQGTSTITVSYGGKTTTFTVTVAQHVIDGWLYHFDGNLNASGTKDFGFTGTANYTTGHDGQAYHHISTDEASTETLGIKATGITDIPDLSGDFTIAFWWAATTALRGHPISTQKCISTTAGDFANAGMSASNIKSGYSIVVSAASGKQSGFSIMFVSQKLRVRLVNAAETAANLFAITLPSTLDTTAFHHYALTRSGSTIRFFIDGQVIFTTIYSGAISFPNQISIGNDFAATSVGTIDQTATGYGDKVDDLYIAESCKWAEEFDPTTITY